MTDVVLVAAAVVIFALVGIAIAAALHSHLKSRGR